MTTVLMALGIMVGSLSWSDCNATLIDHYKQDGGGTWVHTDTVTTLTTSKGEYSCSFEG